MNKMSFINFTNFNAPKQRMVSKDEVLEALLKYETKSEKKALSMLSGFGDQISFNEAVSLFTNKLTGVAAFNILEAEGSVEAEELEDDSKDVTPGVVDAEGEEYAKADDRAEEEPEEVEDEIVDGEDGAKEVGEDEPEKELEVSDEEDLEDALGDDGEDGAKEVADEVEEAEGSIEAEELEDDSEDVTPEVVDAEGEEYAKADDRAEEEPEEVEDEIVDGEDGAKEVGGEETEEDEDEEVEGDIEEAEGSIEAEELEDDSEDVTPEVVDAEGEEYAKADDRAEEEPEEVEDEIVDGEDGAKEVGGEDAQEEEETEAQKNAEEADGEHVEEDGAISTFTKEPTYRFYRDRAEGMIVISKEAMAKLHDEGEVEVDGKTIVMEADLYEATVEVDAIDPNSKDLAKLLKKNRVEMEVVSYGGPTYATPIVKLVGKKKDLEKVLSDEEYGWGDPDLAEFIEEAVAINELSTGTYKAAMQAGLDRKDSRGTQIAMDALNSFGSALAKEMAGQRLEVKSAPKPEALYVSAGLRGQAPKHGQYEIEFTGNGKFLNVDPREVIGSDDVSWLMEVIVRPGESRGWGSDFRFTGYKDFGDKVTAYVQFSIRKGSVEVYTRGSDFSMLEFTRQGARKLANIAQTVALELEMPVKVKHNAIKQFDALTLKVGESVEKTEEITEDWGSSDQSIMDKWIHKAAGSPKQMPSPFDRKLRNAAEDAVDFYWDEWEEYQTDRDSLIDDAVRGYLRRYFKKDFELMQRMFEPVKEDTITERADIEGAYNNMDRLMSRDLMMDFLDIQDNGTWEEMATFIEDNADEDVLSRYKFRSRKDIEALAKYIVDESVVTEGRSIAKIKKEFDNVVSDMAEKVKSWKACKAAGDSKGESECLGELKELTAKKKSLMAELDAAVGLQDADLELAESVVSEARAVKRFDKKLIDKKFQVHQEGSLRTIYKGVTGNVDMEVSEKWIEMKGLRDLPEDYRGQHLGRFYELKKNLYLWATDMKSAQTGRPARDSRGNAFFNIMAIFTMDGDEILTLWERPSNFPVGTHGGPGVGFQYESVVTEAKKPKAWDSMFAMNVIKAYQNGEFDLNDEESILAWDTEYNGGRPPKPAFNTKEIIDYAIKTGKKPDGSKMNESAVFESFESFVKKLK